MKFLLTCAILFLTSCVSDDFNNMADGFMPPTPRDAAIMAADQYDPDVRRKGITLLANSPFGGSPEYLELYRDYIIEDHDPLVRASAIKALARFGTPEDAVIISPWLSRSQTESTQVRRAAAKGLQRLHNQQVVGVMLRSLRDIDEEGQVRANVATALGQYAENQVFVGLISALQTNDLAINLSAAQSLHSLTGQVFGTDWEAWFEWGEYIIAEDENLFAYQSVYEYPTYQHETRWWDRLTFWDYRINETPDIPTGLKDRTKKSTYETETVK